MESKSEKYGLNLQQIKFCEFYVTADFFGNGVVAYAEAYNIDVSKPGQHAVARTGAWRLLTNADILKYINVMLDSEGFNDAFVDKQLLLAITQNADLGAKVAAIREFNKLKKRIEDKLTITVTKFDVKFNDGDNL
ncbi:MAG: hypothetical protein A2Z57_12055 [Planctomycetes bacterium RIFCSPHIGHO2_12_39_6]|nr:MAG: hypothetical protein A2Z57_12055 [Planctomycetes bacterium RIFCSPHIGHO2_12_39_6]